MEEMAGELWTEGASRAMTWREKVVTAQLPQSPVLGWGLPSWGPEPPACLVARVLEPS